MFISNVTPFNNLMGNGSFPFLIALSFGRLLLSFSQGKSHSKMARLKALTFYRSGTFSVDVKYADGSYFQVPPKMSTYTVTRHVSYEILYLRALICLVARSMARFINISLYMCRWVLSNLLKVSERNQRLKLA